MKTLFMLLFLPSVLFAQTYWQQDVHYILDATLNTTDHTVHGKGKLVYRNNSPDVLETAYFHLYWNLFTHGSYGEERGMRFKGYWSDPTGGITLQSFTVLVGSEERTPETAIDNTLMKVVLPRPLAPGDSMIFLFQWIGHVPEGGERTGHQGRDYNIAQWYPQIAVYDRAGWDKSQYLGSAEFYLEYGTFDVSVTLPRSFTLGYSGKLLNPDEVLPDSVRSKLREAEGTTATTRIADYSMTEWDSTATSTTATWKFRAENVRDFAWSANEHYLWDATSWLPAAGAMPVMVQALYFPDKAEYWKNAAEYARHTVAFSSEHFGEYIWPNVFVVEGVVGGGMEYPGITFIGHYGDVENHSPFGVITHEVGHNWYPMMIGSNETANAFMDEGFTTYLTSRATEDYFGRWNNAYVWTKWYQKLLTYPNDDERAGIQKSYFNLAMTGYEEPVATHSYRFTEPNISGISIYSKTGAVLYMLQYVVGDSVFDHAMREYYRKWKLKHPAPADFYAAFEEASGEKSLQWFWDEWFNRVTLCDYGISCFNSEPAVAEGNRSFRTIVGVHKYQPAIMPVDVRISMENGTDTTIFFPIDRWRNDEVEQADTIYCPSRPVKAEINPDGRILDINRLNNVSTCLPVKFRFDNTIVNIPPVDAYLVRWRPSVWYTDEGGWNLGGKLSGSYLDNIYQSSVWGAYNTRDRSLNYDLGISNRWYDYSPLASTFLRWYRIEGRKGVAFSLEKGVRRHLSYPPNHLFRFRYSYSKADNNEYLLQPETWQEGALHRMIAGYEFSDRWRYWSASASLALESSTTLFGRSDFDYAKRTIDLRARFDVPGGWELALRYYNGMGSGTIPGQTQYYFAGSSPIDQIDEPLIRSKGVLPSSVRDHAIVPGGGGMRGYAGMYIAGDKIDAINAEAQFSEFFPFINADLPVLNIVTRRLNSVLFFDAGRITGQAENLWDQRFEVDCGFGFRLTSLYGLLGSVASSDLLSSIGLRTLRVDFPLYVSMPPPDENKLKFRWVLSFHEMF